MPRDLRQLDPVKRIRANSRERQRVSEINKVYDVLLNLLPPAPYANRLSRAQILREAALYIDRLSKYVNSDSTTDPMELFPHVFNAERNAKTNNLAFRRSLKSKEGGVAAFITCQELPRGTSIAGPTDSVSQPAIIPAPTDMFYMPETVPAPPEPTFKPAPVPVAINQNNYYITYL